jgi:PAS domain S-box-containing protein
MLMPESLENHGFGAIETPREDADLRLAAIVDSSDDAIISKNLDGVISTWNAAAERLFGYSEAEAVGQPITLIIPADLRDEERDILRRLRAGERIEHYETRRVGRDGRILHVSITVSPVRNSEGTIVGASKILRDISENKRMQMALRESERRLATELAGVKTLQSISTRLISERTQESLSAQILDAAMELMGADAASVQMIVSDGQSLKLLGWRNFHPESVAFWEQVTAEAGSACGVALQDNKRVHVRDVESCAFMAGTQDLAEYRRSRIRAVQSTPLQTRAGRPLGMLSTHWRIPHTPTEDDLTLFDVLARQAADLIERTRAERALRDSEERFRSVANAAPVIIWMSNVHKYCTYLNQTWLDVTGHSSETGLGTGWTSVMHPDDVVRSWDTYARAFDRRERFQMEYRLRRHDGEYRTMLATGAPRYDGDSVFAGYIGCAVDLTERRQAEEALALINQRLLDAQDEERMRIARELHDDIGQRLAVLHINLDTLLQAVPVSETRPSIQEARDMVGDLAADPARLQYLGIVKAAAALCREIATQHDVQVSFQADSASERLSKRISLCLYRVLQEALQNAVKHSCAREIDVALRRSGDEIELTIQDRGVGFNMGAVDGFGLGLTSMRERLTAVSGQLGILSTPRHGTTIRASVPLPRE